MGQPSKDFALPEDRVASEEISEDRREESATPRTGRMAQNLLPPLHIGLGLTKNFVKTMDRTFIVTCLMYIFRKYITNVCGFLRNRSQF
jgi:hypothetical protein